MRRRLVSYFDHRNRPGADQLADEAFHRLSRPLEQPGAIAPRPPARYCYVVARFVLLEDIRRGDRYVPLDGSRTVELSRTRSLLGAESDERRAIREHRLDCLDRCLLKLNPE